MNADENNQAPVQDELASLKARADMLGIQYHPSIGLEKLKEKVNAAVSAVTSEAAGQVASTALVAPGAAPVAGATVSASAAPLTASTPDAATTAPAAHDPGPVFVAPPPETEGQRKRRLKNEALKLVRIRLTCMNPAKKELHGEIFTVGNSAVGSITKFVPFEAEDGYHVPHILFQQLQQRQCQIFYNEKSKNGVTVRRGKLIREFAIEVLPDLTEEELAELAARQAATRAIDG